MLKNIFDRTISILGLIVFFPFILSFAFVVWINDFSSPFYLADRVGLNKKKFKLIKLRTMIKDADKTGVDSTGNNDARITKVGILIRKFKIDEICGLINVLTGDISLVGPRPNVIREVELYTKEEMRLLTIKPGITDFSSIVFADEGDILADSIDPDIAYNQLIRPGKGKLGLFYIDNQSFFVDIQIILATFISIFSRQRALSITSKLISKLGGDIELVTLSARKIKLVPNPPIGSSEIVTQRGNMNNIS